MPSASEQAMTVGISTQQAFTETLRCLTSRDANERNSSPASRRSEVS
jgi:hypothetical protein